MPTCKGCGDDADELVSVKVDGKTKKLCEGCADEVGVGPDPMGARVDGGGQVAKAEA